MDLSGRTLNRKYELLERIATTNMASVYKARQVDYEGWVAVKVLHEHLTTNATLKRRFELEAKVLMQLKHPQIVNLIDFDTTRVDKAEFVFLVLDYIEGGTLAQLIQQKQKLTVKEAVPIMEQLFAALSYAHGESIAHRDIKPENILFKNEIQIVLSDFGMARLVDSTGITSSTAITVGTLQYMAPEVLQAKSTYNYVLVDIYSLGVVFYEMVTGKTPYHQADQAIISQKLTNQPFPLPHQLNPEVSLAISKVIMRALAFNPQERYQTIYQFSEALRLMPQMSHDEPDAPPSPLQKWLKFTLAALIIVAIAVLTAFLGIEELFLEGTSSPNGLLADLLAGDRDLWLFGCCLAVLALMIGGVGGGWLWQRRKPIPRAIVLQPEPNLAAPPKVETKSSTDKTLIRPQLQQQPITGVLVMAEGVTGFRAGTTYSLRVGINSIGRIPDNHIVFNDNSISRYHARVMVKDNNFMVEDLRSSNGVKVNGVKVAAQVLQENDVVEFGRIKLNFILTIPEKR